MSDEEEYEVESVSVARVGKKPGRGRGLIWQYRVKLYAFQWKGYSSDEDTWEPAASFQGSEMLLETFWSRVDTGGRDHTDISLFKHQEQFHPTGRPVPKGRRSLPKLPAQDVPSSSRPSEPKRRRKNGNKTDTSSVIELSSPLPVPAPLPQSLRPSPEKLDRITANISSRITKRKRDISPEVIPQTPSESTDDDALLQTPPPRPIDKPVSVPSPEAPEPSTDLTPSSPVPAHRSKAANPLIKTLETPYTADAIPIEAKTRAMAQASTSQVKSSASKPRPGPGRSSSGLLSATKSRSSLLTASKGKLSIRKGKYVAPELPPSSTQVQPIMDVDEEVTSPTITSGPKEAPPSSAELLQAAGLDPAQADILEDFTDNAAEANGRVGFTSPFQQSLTLFATTAAAVALEPPASSWIRPTIFGPLFVICATIAMDSLLTLLSRGSGSESVLPTLATTTTSTTSPPFSLTLDISISMSVVFTDVVPSTHGTPDLHEIARNQSHVSVAKFYKGDKALEIVAILRSGRSYGYVLPTHAASTDYFPQFNQELLAGALCMVIAGAEALAFWSSDNVLISQRLNIPLEAPGKIIVANVSIEDHSAYSRQIDHTVHVDWVI